MQNLASVVASIPSPSENQIKIGPIPLNAYGLCIGLGVVAGIVIATRRWKAIDRDPDEIAQIALFAVLAGIVGARLYHVITDSVPLEQAFKIWEGGLGIPGGLIAGIFAGWLVTKVQGYPVNEMIFAAIPGIPIAQAFGRFGNYFNQELFGRPTDVPWALEIDRNIRTAVNPEFALEQTFHPTFAYEALWNIGLFLVLVFLGRKKIIQGAEMLPAYVLGYGVGRFIVELMRSDGATEIAGLRVNTWVSGTAIVLSIIALIVLRKRRSVIDVNDVDLNSDDHSNRQDDSDIDDVEIDYTDVDDTDYDDKSTTNEDLSE